MVEMLLSIFTWMCFFARNGENAASAAEKPDEYDAFLLSWQSGLHGKVIF
jgi:hypothetical protein